ncbi:MAG: DNA (cytosine-5-)-methyltransferase [Gemmatimonadaceae bacterium]
MADKFLIRKVDEELQVWLGRESRERGMSRQEFTLAMLRHAYDADFAQKAPLLADPPVEAPRKISRPHHQMPFTFVDLFAGIGGMRVALEGLGGRCLFSCEWDKWSQKTYRAWFGETPAGDIREIDPADIPDHDVLTAGFPCQPFSIAGVSKKKSLGHQHGFKCDVQGNLFFYLATVAAIKRPPVLFLENVKNLKSHDQGRTWGVISETLDGLGYEVFKQVIDAQAWVPQHRERVYIVCFDRKIFGTQIPFQFPDEPAAQPKFRDIMESEPSERYTLTDHLWKYLQAYAKKHKEKGNGFGYGLVDLNGAGRTLSARYFKDGSEILIPQEGKNPRRMTPLECSRYMGFGDRKIVVSDTQAYRQFGNAVVPLVVGAVGQQILNVLAWQLTQTKNGCLLKRPLKGPSLPVTAAQLQEQHYGVSPRGAHNRGRNVARQRDSKVHLTQ